MDYTKVPRELIYRERHSLEEFGVYKENNITRPFLDELLKFGSDRYPNIEENALWCMNNAFYICTMILLEKDPRPRIYQYKKIATPENINDRFISDKYWSVVLSIVFLLLERTGGKLTRYQDEARHCLLTLIAKNVNSVCTTMFNSLSKRIKDDTAIPIVIPCSMFAPRIIDKETVLDVFRNNEFDWEGFTDEMRERKVREIVNSFGTTEEEKHNVVKILRQALHDTYRETEEEDKMLDEIDKEIKLYFSPGEKKDLKETTKQEKQVDITPYENRIKELEEENKKLNNLTKDLQKKLDEAHTIPDNVSAQQRVRMELARKIMDKAGINKTILDKWGNKDKAGTLMGTMLDIPSTTCKTYLSDSCLNTTYHKDIIDKINPLLKELGVDIQL